MAATTMKVELEVETCCVCGGGGDLFTPEEHDANAPPLQPPLRTMLLQLSNAKVVPEGRVCSSCARRAADAYEFSATLGARAAPPLSDKIRALRRRLHELTQKIDVFIVVGGPGAGGGAGGAGGGHAYAEDDIIMVERAALAAAAAADAEEPERARNARGEPVHQCSVCPQWFPRAHELRRHAQQHAPDARHSCWTCGAQFPSRGALAEHARSHSAAHALTCYLCDTDFQSQAELRRHEAACPARCPARACGAALESRAALARHAAQAHGRGAAGELVCPACFRSFPAGGAELLSAHLLRHRQATHFVCGYADCVLRFATRNNLMAHIRKCHASELPPERPEPAESNSFACQHCDRQFASSAALKRHARVHRDLPPPANKQEETAEGEVEMEMEKEGEGEGVQYAVDGEGEALELEDAEVEYLEVETLEEADGDGDGDEYANAYHITAHEHAGGYELKLHSSADAPAQ